MGETGEGDEADKSSTWRRPFPRIPKFCATMCESVHGTPADHVRLWPSVQLCA
ncbi:hypothetical protein Droror1_Dr00001146 [Drosera rotundifolia]